MNSTFKKSALMVAAVLTGSQLMAQTITSTTDTTTYTKDYVQPFAGGSAYRNWSIGLHGGMISPWTPLRGKQDFVTPNEQWGYGGYVKYQLLPALGFQADFFKGHLQGTTPQQPTNLVKFRTDIKYAVDLSANITIANINWRHNHGAIQPYVTVGGGSIAYAPKLYTADGRTVQYNSDGRNINQFYIPLGVGLKVGLAPGINLDLGYQVNFMDGDNIDGYTYGGRNDQFAYAHAGLEFALGKRSKPQLANHNPVSSMRTEYLSKTNALAGELAQQRMMNEQLRNDLNTTNANLARLTADTDGDGVPDAYDKCPNTQRGVKVDGSGCPLPTPVTKVYVTEEDRKVVREAIKNLEFDFGKATIKEHSLSSLDRVADILTSKNFSLKLAGHTDNVGSDAANLKLSKDRAESVKEYLVSKGANPSRIEAVGYGETQPIASNKTDAGRQKNRRVEFTLY
ncbi:OmpA family protein [Mucilaginibacter koreensis]